MECACYDGKKADSYSAGVLLFVMLTGKLPVDIDPFEIEHNAVGALRKALEKSRRPWREALGPGARRALHTLTADALDLLDRLLHPEEEQRMGLEEAPEHAWCRRVACGAVAWVGEDARQAAAPRVVVRAAPPPQTRALNERPGAACLASPPLQAAASAASCGCARRDARGAARAGLAHWIEGAVLRTRG